MQYDEKALEILDRKLRRFEALGAIPQYEVCLLELPSILQWVLSVPVLRSYVQATLAMHDHEETSLARSVDSAIDAFEQSASEVRALPAFASPTEESRWPSPLQWSKFDDALAVARASKSPDQRRESAATMAYVLSARANDAWKASVEAAPEASVLDGIDATVGRAREAWEPLERRLAARTLTLETSPRAAFVRLIEICHAQNPPSETADDADDWTRFVPREPAKAIVESIAYEENSIGFYKEAVVALPRFIEHLHVLGATTLSHRVLVERFKDRCSWYDKDRMREIAEARGKGREDRLTLELAKYLHDNGVLSLVRMRVSNLEPDIVSNGLAVEAKAYVDSKHSRQDIIDGYAQLHGYMTTLDTGAARVTEGFLVAFRVRGPVYEVPRLIDTGRFLIHGMIIDLGEGDVSGSNQPTPDRIDESEIFPAFSAQAPTKQTPAKSKPRKAAPAKKKPRSR